jgi:hypothetical protein
VDDYDRLKAQKERIVAAMALRDDPAEAPPEGLDEAGRELWRQATAALAFDGVQSVALRIRQELRLEARIRRAEADRDRLRAVVSMAVARLGGEVEGRPTHAGNFLQRIDELRRIEAAKE